jgi:SAM-dependent methyltransferase
LEIVILKVHANDAGTNRRSRESVLRGRAKRRDNAQNENAQKFHAAKATGERATIPAPMRMLDKVFGRHDDRHAASLTEEDIALAYRLALGRDVDADGLAAYRLAGQRGMSLSALLRALVESDEFKARSKPSSSAVGANATPTPPIEPPAADPNRITPADVIARYSLEQLNQTAEEYYRRIPDPTPLMAKPFAYWHETPQMLHDLGVLLSGMRLGKAMRVLDFGAGTGWLTRILAQLQCDVVACDVSDTALAIGRKLFEVSPPLGDVVYSPAFLHFDGEHLDLPDASVDRIVCFDAFHHVPNPARVIAELARVLVDGGIAGFSEPGRFHSRSPQSQYEMRHHRVLENDIDLEWIFERAREVGFTSLTIRPLSDVELSLDEYRAAFSTSDSGPIGARVWHNVRDTLVNRSVFFLHKGEPRLDSRGHEGLAHEMTVDRHDVLVAAGAPISLRFSLRNTGQARWLHEGREIFGLVRLGSHLAHADGTLIDLDFSRHPLPASVAPGESIDMEIALVLPEPGEYRLTFDLVAEGVSWFENLGSRPVEVRVRTGRT